MVDYDVVAAKLAELADRIARVREHRPESVLVLEEDRDVLDLVSFNLQLAVQSCVDLAAHVIADEDWQPAPDQAGSFRRLAENGVLTTETAAHLARAAGLRNIIAHLYAQVVPDRIFDAATNGPAQLEQFAREIATWAQGRRGGPQADP